jgi:hypothetical protein
MMMINVLLLFFAMAGDPATCPMHAQHTTVETRGDDVMGFSHEKTKHSFRLLEEGGAIEVRANDAADAESIASIRTHLREIAQEFTAGTFTKPEEIHARTPDGVETMKERGAAIAFEYEELERGARVHIKTKDNVAREAVHAFLRFQIDDHHTGDALTIE